MDTLNEFLCDDLVDLVLSYAWPKKFSIIYKYHGRGGVSLKGISILRQACRWGHWELAMKEIKQLDDSNGYFDAGLLSALREACRYKYLKLAEKILSYDIPWNVSNYKDEKFCDKILSEACRKNWADVARFVLTNGDPNLELGLFEACGCGSTDVAEILLKFGAKNVDVCLMYARENNHLDCMQLMIDNNATDFRSHEWS